MNEQSRNIEKAWKILNEYYPSWETMAKEVWGKEIDASTIDLVIIERLSIMAKLLNQRSTPLRYKIDTRDLGIILEEENLDGDWSKEGYLRLNYR